MIEQQLEEIANRLTDISHHLARLVDAQLGAAGALPSAEETKAAAPAEEPKRKRKAAEAAPAAPQAPAEPAPAPEAEPAPTAPATLDDVRAAFAKLAAAKGRDVCIQVLSRFGVPTVKGLTPAQYPQIVADCERVAAGGEP